MKHRQLFIIVFLAITIATNAQVFISVKGKEIIGANGKPFLIKGTNLGNWLLPEGYMFKFENATSARLINEAFTELIGPDDAKAFWKKYLGSYITRKDIHYLKSTGMNSIRVPFNYRLFTTENYMGDNDASRGFKYLDSVVKWCKAEGLYVLLDMHAAPGGQTGDNIDDSYGYPFLYENAGSRTLCIKIWRDIAARYKNETIIMGYDLLNEPIPHFLDTAHFNPMLEPLYKELVKAVRQVDKKHLIFLGGAQWDSNFNVFGPPFDDKLVYQFHKYWTDTTQAVIQSYIDFRDKYNVPIYCGETGENNDAWIEGFRHTLERNNIGWHYWPYKKMDNTSGIMNFERPAQYDVVIKYADSTKKNIGSTRDLRPKNIEAVKQALQDYLRNCRFENCFPNKGYIRALGLK